MMVRAVSKSLVCPTGIRLHPLIDCSGRLEGQVGFRDADVFAPAKLLKENRIGIVAGIIAGYPDDTAETIRQRFDHFLALNPDMIYAQYLTPYPKTVLRDEMLKDGLVANVDDFTKYDGFTCNTRTRHLSQSELYRCLKRQALRAYLTPSLIFQNYFIRNYLWSFLGGQIINLAATIGYILRGNQGRASLDL